MNNIDQILSDNYEQLDKLKSELQQIENLKERIQELKDSNEKLPEEFRKKFQIIIEHATEYNNNLGSSVKLFVDGNNDLLVKNINQIESNISQFQKVNDDFKAEITRLSKIDLEDHFNKHQSKLSEVFISVNGINSILTSISQNFNNIIKNFGEIEQTLAKNQKEICLKIDSLTETQEKNKNELLDKINESETKLSSIITATESLRKEAALNKKLNFIIIALLVVTVIFIALIKK
ncbi:hypothetical protein LNQ49_06605 [Flavobacterium sp. F-65]|uniref:Uncharacterized protein n=1 Tax=Flavobacterium pisciphilum TaxID=2893755 RepID=A0ABS8MR77_9FLAO|nr:hypothetical protein [Flavobacterium sp. F-65]MCC9071264.1 hypothetical protein [Flavobacterium sp. F-65]